MKVQKIWPNGHKLGSIFDNNLLLLDPNLGLSHVPQSNSKYSKHWNLSNSLGEGELFVLVAHFIFVFDRGNRLEMCMCMCVGGTVMNVCPLH